MTRTDLSRTLDQIEQRFDTRPLTEGEYARYLRLLAVYHRIEEMRDDRKEWRGWGAYLRAEQQLRRRSLFLIALESSDTAKFVYRDACRELVKMQTEQHPDTADMAVYVAQCQQKCDRAARRVAEYLAR